MNSLFNKIIDFFVAIISKLSVLLIILILGLIIFSRIDKLFKMDLIGESISSTEKSILANNSGEDIVEKAGPAEIVYEGNIKPEDSASAVSAVGPNEEEAEIISFEIAEGQSPKEVADNLKGKGLIQDPFTFVTLLENSNLLDRVRVGSYKVPENIKNMELIEAITIPPETESQEELEIINFEIKQEHTPEDVAKLLLDKGFIQDPPSFILLLEDNGLMDRIEPGVYRLPREIKNSELIQTITTPHEN